MNYIKLLTYAILGMILSSCSPKNNGIMWVGGDKHICNDEQECYYVHKGENLESGEWESLSKSIKGYNHEDGIMKKISYKEDNTNELTLVEVLESKSDPRSDLTGEWLLTLMMENPIDKSIILPNLNIEPKKMKFYGSGGCNNYFGNINILTDTKINFGDAGTTMMACPNENIEQDYLVALSKVSSYKASINELILYNGSGKAILSYIKNNQPKQQINDIWVVTHINGNEIDVVEDMERPRLEINLADNTVMGTDGCNNFNGNIASVSGDELLLSSIGSTKKLCKDMKTANAFLRVLNETKFYKHSDMTLTLMDDMGKEILRFRKID